MDIIKTTTYTDQLYDLLLLADPSKKLVDDYLARGICFSIKKAEPIAVMVLLPTHPETLEIVNIAVDERYQGQGLAQKLLHFAIQYAESNDYRTLEIGTGSTCFQQLYLYQKCGFRMSSIEHNFFVDHYDEKIVENGLILKDMVRLQMKLPKQ